MSRFLVLVAICSSLVTGGCASRQPTELDQRIIGSWIFDASVMGERTQELLTVHADGSFDAKVFFTNGIGMVGQYVEYGEWAIDGNDVAFSTKMRNGKVCSPEEAAPDRQVIKQLDNDVFVTADKKFGIELRRIRVPGGYSLPGWDERLMEKIEKRNSSSPNTPVNRTAENPPLGCLNPPSAASGYFHR